VVGVPPCAAYEISVYIYVYDLVSVVCVLPYAVYEIRVYIYVI